MSKNQSSVFEGLTRKYELSKTLRFELRPVGKTREMLEEAGVFEKDRIIKEKYEKTKPYFDRMHREFVQDSLSGVVLSDLAEYFQVFSDWNVNRKDSAKAKRLESVEKSLRREVVAFLDENAKSWAERYASAKIKKSGIEFLFEEGIFRILKERYGDETDAFVKDDAGNDISIFDQWKGFVGYFKKFHETRKNFYKDDGTSTAIATRAIDQNLRRFCDNALVFNRLREKVDFSEVESDFGVSIEEIFSPRFYDTCLLQEGIDRYNAILGGDSTDQNKKGINQYVNKYIQDHKGERLPFLKPLDKQILSKKEAFLIGIENEEELASALERFKRESEKRITIFRGLVGRFISDNDSFDLSKIYLSKEGLNTISRKWTDDFHAFETALYEVMKTAKVKKLSKKDDSYEFPDHIALSYLREALSGEVILWKERYRSSANGGSGILAGIETGWEQFLRILSSEVEGLFSAEVTRTIGHEEDFSVALETAKRFEEVVSSDEKTRAIRARVGYDIFARKMGSVSETLRDADDKVFIKYFADSVLHIYQMAKYFSLEKKGKWNEDYELDAFYTEPETGYLAFYEDSRKEIVKAYDALRNYLTKKPYSEEKWKLNFENPTLANGWDKNKEADNAAVILRKDGRYFLGVMKKGKTRIFSEKAFIAENFSSDNSYEKTVYKLFPDPAKMMPKVCFSAKGLEFFNPSAEIMDIYKQEKFKKGESFDVGSMQTLIRFYKECLSLYPGWKVYDFSNVKEANKYTRNIGEFYSDVARAGYKIEFVTISEEYIREKNESGDLYLFEIHNKDWNLKDGERKMGAKNLHTMYFESLFSKENAQANFPMKLNGEAELFYRPATDSEKLGFKKNPDGTAMVGKDGRKVVNRKRYSEDRILFHVPMTMNRGKGSVYRFNDEVNELLAKNPDINIIGVDRGEKHLAYYSVINRAGETLESGSLNYVGKNGEGKAVDYEGKLEKRAKGREQARKDWQAVEGIKDLKKGYVSQVVRKLADLAIEHDAIIVLEDLNMRFKQIRGGIEKSVYQQLERALIDKLSFLVEKGEKDPESAGHLLRAYQLVAPFESFQKLGKQTGIVFYTQASYTSKIDPATGWRPNLYLKYSNAKKAKEDVAKFDDIAFRDGRFEFSYDLKQFANGKKGAEYPERTDWTVCSNVERFRWNRKLNAGKGGYEHYPDLTDNFHSLFASVGIGEKDNIKAKIADLEPEGNERFFRDFMFLFGLVCQIRNTDPETKDVDKADFILSPVAPFFDSRNEEKGLPKNGDENGAYNIARKGIVVLDKLSSYKRKNGSYDDLKWGDLYVSHKEWDDFARKHALDGK